MRNLTAALAVALACLAFGVAAPSPTLAQTYSPAARQVIARAQAASGGAGWKALRGLHETGQRDGQPYKVWVDPVRYGHRVETQESAGLRIHGFNGWADWQVLPGGRIVGVDDQGVLAQARTAAFLAAYGFYYPSRFAADGAHIGVRQAGGRGFDVLRVRPAGGEPRELWFDRRTHLLARIVDRTGSRPVTTELSDYRRVGALLLPFRATNDRGGRLEHRQAEAITLATPDRNLFSWAPPGAEAHEPSGRR
ncbi:MAG: hypothetical protein ABW360_12590 [Phenylobacterium sp.]